MTVEQVTFNDVCRAISNMEWDKYFGVVYHTTNGTLEVFSIGDCRLSVLKDCNENSYYGVLYAWIKIEEE